MSFSNLKKRSKQNFANLAKKMNEETEKGNYTDDRFWQPDVDKSGSGFAIIRFLPAVDGEDSPFVKVFSHGFKNGAKWYIEECPTTISLPCPVCEANNELWNTGTKENQDIVRRRKRRQQYISNIVVLNDQKNPENEGKVFLYKYGSKIFGKLLYAIKPEFDDEESFDPFDLWNGANFKLKIRNQEGFRNYDKSEFEPCGPLFDDDEAMEAIWKKEYALNEFLFESKFKPYAELSKKLETVLGAPAPAVRVTEEDDDVEEPVRETPKSRPAPKAKPQTTTEDDEDDFELFSKLIED